MGEYGILGKAPSEMWDAIVGHDALHPRRGDRTPVQSDCFADFDNNGVVNVADLLTLIEMALLTLASERQLASGVCAGPAWEIAERPGENPGGRGKTPEKSGDNGVRPGEIAGRRGETGETPGDDRGKPRDDLGTRNGNLRKSTRGTGCLTGRSGWLTRRPGYLTGRSGCLTGCFANGDDSPARGNGRSGCLIGRFASGDDRTARGNGQFGSGDG